MRFFILALVVAAVGCTTTTAPEPEEVNLRGEASESCIDNNDWAYAVNRGEVVYRENCDYCHQDNGKGQSGKVPSLAGNKSLMADPARGIRLITSMKAHAKPKGEMAADGMVAIFDDLSNQDIADVLSYVRASWGNCADPVSVDQVKAVAVKM